MDLRERLAALDAMFAGIVATERTRDPKEPPPEINDAYVKLLFAVGYGRLGNAARAAELEAAARAQLEGCRADPIHAWLRDAFAEQISSAAQVLPMSLRDRLDAFDRVPRYKVDKFREAALLLAGEPVDALTHFTRGGKPPDDMATRTRWTAEAVERAVAGADAAIEKDEADAYIEGALEVAGGKNVEPSYAASVLARFLPHVEHMTDRRSCSYTRAIQIAAKAAPAQLPGLIASFAALEPWAEEGLLFQLMEALVTNHRSELAELWHRVPPVFRSSPAYRLGLLRLGAAPVLDDLFEPSCLRIPTLDAVLARPFPARFDGAWALRLFATATDDLSTNSHFTYAVIYIVDRIVRGLVDP